MFSALGKLEFDLKTNIYGSKVVLRGVIYGVKQNYRKETDLYQNRLITEGLNDFQTWCLYDRASLMQ